MRCLHQQLALPLADAALKGCYFKSLHVVAMDGSTLALQDTKSNGEAFGRSANQNGAAAYPLARFVALVECGTHLIFEAQLGSYHQSEVRLAQGLVKRLKPGMLCLADRLFSGYDLWEQAMATGAHLLWRAKAGMRLDRIKSLADGSWLARWYPSARGKDPKAYHLVRVIEYKLREVGAPDQGDPPVYRLLTTLLDPEQATATELAELYPQRWEIELTIKEGKSVLRHGQPTLRSKVAELVHQEFWGLLLAHYLVRKMMAQAALKRGVDPDGLSYQSSVEIIKSTQTGPVLSLSPSTKN